MAAGGECSLGRVREEGGNYMGRLNLSGREKKRCLFCAEYKKAMSRVLEYMMSKRRIAAWLAHVCQTPSTRPIL